MPSSGLEENKIKCDIYPGCPVVPYMQSRRQRSTDEGATEVTKGGDDVAQSKNK